MPTPKPTELPERLSMSVYGDVYHDLNLIAKRFSGSLRLMGAMVERYNTHPSLLHEVEELRKDKARLDWLENNIDEGISYDDGFYVNRIGPSESVRQAIDTAIIATK